MIAFSLTTGCTQIGTSGSTSADPMVYTWDFTIYLTRISWDKKPIVYVEAPVRFTVSDYGQQTDALDMQYFPLCAFPKFEMGDRAETFQLLQDADLPYFYGHGCLVHTVAGNSRHSVSYAFDVHRGIMVICTGIDAATYRPEFYWVGSLDPDVEPSEIAEHFQGYLDYYCCGA